MVGDVPQLAQKRRMAAYVRRVLDAQAQGEARGFGRSGLAETFHGDFKAEILVRLVLGFGAEAITEQAASGELTGARAAVEVEGKGCRSEPLSAICLVARIGVREISTQATELGYVH